MEISTVQDDETNFSGKQYKDTRESLIKYFSARRCADPENLADETIVRWLNYLAQGKPAPSSDKGFLYGIAKNVWHEEGHRTSPLVPLDELPAGDEPAGSDDPYRELLQAEYRRHTQQAWQSLAPKDRELYRRYFSDWESPAERIVGRARLAQELRVPTKKLSQQARTIFDRLVATVRQRLGVKIGQENSRRKS
jgi:hypothetical protein